MIGLAGLPVLPRLSLTQWLLGASLALNGVLVVALYGLQVHLPLVGKIGPEGVIAERDEARATAKTMIAERKAAQAESDRIARANTNATEKADADVTKNLTQERAGADAFIVRGGVRRCPAARADTPAAGQSSSVDAGAGAVPVVDDLPDVVTVLPEDVRVCTENTVKARAWQEWGLSIAKNSTP